MNGRADRMFSKHYQDELAFLRTAGKAYSDANPSTAALLGTRGGDPDVERLLEGFAFLAARVRERVEATVPEVVHDLAELLVPQFLRPVPASTIVEMTPRPGALRSRLRVPAGTELATAPLDGTACRFQTTADLDLVPVTVLETALDRSIGSAPCVRVQLQAAQAALPAVFDSAGLRFYVHGEFPLASMIAYWLARHLGGVRVRGLGSHRSAELPASAVRLVGLGPELPLLPWPSLAPGGSRLLQEYFTLPEKMLFAEVRGLDQVRALASERFELAFQMDHPPELPAPLPRDAFRTNCVPALNLFRTSAEPVAVRAVAEEHLVRAAGLPPQHMSIHSVEEVLGRPEGQGLATPHPPFFAFRDAERAGSCCSYRLRRRLSPIDGGFDTFLSLAAPRGAARVVAPQTLSMEVMATNRGLAGRLQLGDLRQPTSTSPQVARFRDIVPMSQPVMPPLGAELHWRVLAHLAAHRAPLATAEELRALLGLCNLSLLPDRQAGRANQLRVESVRGVEVGASRRLVRGAPVHGTSVSLRVDEAGFAGLGDAFLFGCAVDELMASQVGLGSFVELALRVEPSLRECAWPPRNGARRLLG